MLVQAKVQLVCMSSLIKKIDYREKNIDLMENRIRHNYKNLKIWQLSLDIANVISDILTEFPRHERYDLSSQLNKCSVSIPSNIAEGSSRTDKSFSHFIDIALGSSFELLTQLLVAKHRNYINNNTLKSLEEKIEEFQRMTMGFQNKLK